MFVINEVENVLLNLQKEGLIRGPINSSIGQEAIATAIVGLDKSDLINGTYRAVLTTLQDQEILEAVTSTARRKK
ncbi:MAG: hypothetical protein F6K01_17185 [Okeania sp. SIO1I7]|nr:hypothetical protein [Okeania sp. SIO1I7]